MVARMMRAFALTALLLASLVAVPSVAADHATCNNDPTLPQAVRTACFVAAGGIHFALVSAELVVDYVFCFLTTPPVGWAGCV